METMVAALKQTSESARKERVIKMTEPRSNAVNERRERLREIKFWGCRC